MFDLSWSHIFIFLVVALVVVGPKDMPRLLKTVGRWVGKAKSITGEFQKNLEEMAEHSELDELRKEIEKIRLDRFDEDNAKGTAKGVAAVIRPQSLPIIMDTPEADLAASAISTKPDQKADALV